MSQFDINEGKFSSQVPPEPRVDMDVHPPIGPVIPAVLAEQAAAGSRGAAWRLLHQLVKGDPSVVQAVVALDDERLIHNIIEFLALGTWAGKSFIAPPVVRSAHAKVRLRNLFLPGSGVSAEKAEGVLLSVLHDSRPVLRANALYILGLAGRRSAIPAMLDALKDPAATVRVQAVRGLGRTGDAAVVPALLQVLKSADEQMGSQIFLALVDIGSAALPALIEESYSASAWMRWHCMRALGEIYDDRAVPTLVQGLADNDHAVVWMAAKSLPRFGLASVKPTLELLMVADMSPWLSEATSYVLHEQCLYHAELKPYLAPVLQSMQNLIHRPATALEANKALEQLKANDLLTDK